MTLLIGASGSLLTAVGPSPAQAAVPEVPATEPFQAPQSVGETEFDPTQSGDVFPDLTEVFGQRLAEYNAGKMVILYDSQGANDIFIPLCGTRYVPGVGAASEWMYCTDFLSHQCSVTDAEGRLTQDGTVVDGLVDLDVNPKLDADQERIIRYLLTNTVSLMDGRQPVVSSDANYDTRRIKQRSIWCISEDPADYHPNAAQFCADNFSEEKQNALLASLPADPVFTPTLSAGSQQATVDVCDVVEVDLTTNIYETPITVSAPGADIAVCRDSSSLASMVNGRIVLHASAADTTTVTVCLSWQSAGTHAIDFSVTPEGTTTQALSWVQSPTLIDGKPCQVYSGFDSVAGRTLTARLSVTTTVPAGPEEPGSPTDPVDPGEHEDPDAPTQPSGGEAAAKTTVRTLATTGGDSMLAFGTLGALLAAAGVALWAVQRRTATGRAVAPATSQPAPEHDEA